jgi:hypothetical protein
LEGEIAFPDEPANVNANLNDDNLRLQQNADGPALDIPQNNMEEMNNSDRQLSEGPVLEVPIVRNAS